MTINEIFNDLRMKAYAEGHAIESAFVGEIHKAEAMIKAMFERKADNDAVEPSVSNAPPVSTASNVAPDTDAIPANGTPASSTTQDTKN